jgi:hypothetical protein
MDTIYVEWVVTETTGYENIPLDSLNCESREEWDRLTSEERLDRLQTALDELPERVGIVVETWD